MWMKIVIWTDWQIKGKWKMKMKAKEMKFYSDCFLAFVSSKMSRKCSTIKSPTQVSIKVRAIIIRERCASHRWSGRLISRTRIDRINSIHWRAGMRVWPLISWWNGRFMRWMCRWLGSRAIAGLSIFVVHLWFRFVMIWCEDLDAKSFPIFESNLGHTGWKWSSWDWSHW